MYTVVLFFACGYIIREFSMANTYIIFLQNEDLVSKFTEVYDIVLVDDQTLDVPIELIQYICG